MSLHFCLCVLQTTGDRLETVFETVVLTLPVLTTVSKSESHILILNQLIRSFSQVVLCHVRKTSVIRTIE